jgi:fused signal recognition particle receptor
VVYDAVQAAKTRGTDLILVDTAGRLHTKSNLMEELKKIGRVCERELGRKPDEILLALDATTGQNAIRQAQEFVTAVGVTGIVLAKLDGTARGGIVLTIREELGVPIKLVGVGEQPGDLLPFDPETFVDAMLDTD